MLCRGYDFIPFFLAACAILFVLVRVFENSFIYYPSVFPDGDWSLTVGRTDIDDVTLESADGTELNGWFFHAERTDKAGLLFFHGNAGNISHRFDWCSEFARQGLDVFIIDYRGYGKSRGNPDEAGIYQDARAAYEYFTGDRGMDPSRLFIYGNSLGGGPAAETASRYRCAGLILQSTFTSVPAMSRTVIPLIPIYLFMKTRFDNITKLKNLKTPKLIIHSRDDELIPVEMARRLYEAAAPPKQIQIFSGPNHNSLVTEKRVPLLKVIMNFISENLPVSEG